MLEPNIWTRIDEKMVRFLGQFHKKKKRQFPEKNKDPDFWSHVGEKRLLGQ